MVLIARVFDLAIFRKNRKNLICVSVSVCMCVCVHARVCVCKYKYDKSKQCYNCQMHKTISHVFLRNVTKVQKFINWTFWKNGTCIHDANFYLLEILFSFLGRLKCCIHKILMKTYFYRHFLLSLSCQVLTKDRTNLKKPATKSCRFL